MNEQQVHHVIAITTMFTVTYMFSFHCLCLYLYNNEWIEKDLTYQIDVHVTCAVVQYTDKTNENK